MSGLATRLASSAEEFFQQLESTRVDVVLLAADAEPKNTHDVLSTMRRVGSPHRDIPVLMVYSSGAPTELQLEGMHLGAYGYLVEPFDEIELLTKVTVLAKVKRAQDEFRKLAIRDKLTGLFDRRYLFMRFSEELSRAKRYSVPISCAVIDVDGFAKANQHYGTEAGDALLQMVADVLKKSKREIDVLARYGGDTFVLVLYNTDDSGAMVLLSRAQSELLSLSCPFDDDYHAHVSIGLTTLDAEPEITLHAQELLQRAQAAMVEAKSLGGNRIVVYSDELAGAVPEQ